MRTPLHGLHAGIATRVVRRQITPRTGFALEILGHAIEYLADEYALASGAQPSLRAEDPEVQAIRLLMAANRQVYYSCPVIPSMSDRFRRWALRWMR